MKKIINREINIINYDDIFIIGDIIGNVIFDYDNY